MDNKAAWITESKGKPLKVDAGPKPSPGAEEVVIRVVNAAVNPVDWKIQDYGLFIQSYPNILGTDVAGEIVQVGSQVERLKVGQRVLGHCIGLGTGKPTDGGFQHYSTVPEITVAPIPDSLPYANASVLPLAISTAAAGLFQSSHLNLSPPTLPPSKPTGKTILIWGGSSSVGGTAIQLASAAGVTVATTASSHNHEYVKSLGATHVFDHTKSGVVDDIVKALKGSDFAGVYDAISEEKTVRSSADIASQLGGGIVVTVLPPPEGLPENVKALGVFAITVATEHKDVGDAVWRKFVPQALAQGKLQAKPDPLLIKGGLEKVQEGLDKQKAGVSAKKVVIEIQGM